MISAIKNDITKMETDAIVNASDKKLSGGGGIDRAIHIAAGKELLRKELLTKGMIETGKAIITKGYNLKAKYIIHTAGPICKSGIVNEQKKDELASCYISALNIARENGIKSLSFPCISTGVYKFPKELASEIAVDSVRKWLKENNYEIDVIFVCFDNYSYSLYTQRI